MLFLFSKRAGGWLLLVTISCVLAYAFIVHRMWKQQELELDSVHEELATLRAELRTLHMSEENGRDQVPAKKCVQFPDETADDRDNDVDNNEIDNSEIDNIEIDNNEIHNNEIENTPTVIVADAVVVADAVMAVEKDPGTKPEPANVCDKQIIPENYSTSVTAAVPPEKKARKKSAKSTTTS